MTVLILIAIVACLVWLAVLLKYVRPVKIESNLVPLGGLAVVLAGCVLSSDFFSISSSPIPITLDRILWLMLLAGFVVLLWLRREQLKPLDRTDALVAGLLAILTASTLMHDWQYKDNLPASRLLFFNLMPIAVYWVVKNANFKLWELKTITATLAAFGIYLAVIGVAEVRGWSGLVFPSYIANTDYVEFLGRGRGPFLNPVSNGIFQVVCLCALLMWWPHVGVRGKVLIGCLTPVFLAGIYSTMTRSVWVGLVAGVGLCLWLPAQKKLKGMILLGGTIATVLLAGLFLDDLASFKRDKHVTEAEMAESASLRPLFAIVAWEMFKDRPIFGHGFGQYTRTKLPYLSEPHHLQPLLKTKPYMQHNVFLSYLTETGLLGMGVLIAVLLNLAYISLALWRDRARELWVRQFGLLMLVLLSAYVINGMLHDVSIIPMTHMLLFFMAGLISNLYSAGCAPRPALAGWSRPYMETSTTRINPASPKIENSESDRAKSA